MVECTNLLSINLVKNREIFFMQKRTFWIRDYPVLAGYLGELSGTQLWPDTKNQYPCPHSVTRKIHFGPTLQITWRSVQYGRYKITKEYALRPQHSSNLQKLSRISTFYQWWKEKKNMINSIRNWNKFWDQRSSKDRTNSALILVIYWGTAHTCRQYFQSNQEWHCMPKLERENELPIATHSTMCRVFQAPHQ